MFSKPHNQNLLNDVMKNLGSKNPENTIHPAPQWVVDASHDAAKTLSEAYASGQVVTSETKRDILRKHFSEAVGNCGCNASKDDPIHFEKEVQKRMAEGIVPTKKLATPKTVAQKTAKPPTKGMPVNKGLASEGIVSTDKLATPNKVAQKTAKPPTKGMPVNKGLASHKESIEADMRHFLTQLTEEEIEVLSDVVLEAKMGKKQIQKN